MFEWMTTKNVLITGAKGFIGNHVIRALMDNGLNPAGTESPPLCDLRKEPAIREVLDLAKPEAVIHLAALVGGVQKNEKEPATMFHDNMLMSMNVSKICAERGTPLIMTGTPCSYPENAPMPLEETSLWKGYPAQPNDGYGISKLAILAYMGTLHRQVGKWRSAYLIPFNTYGPGDHTDPARSHVLPGIMVRIATAVAAGKNVVEVWGSPETTRCFVYVRDVADAFVRAVDYVGKIHPAASWQPLPINVGSPEEITIEDLSGMIATEMGSKVSFKFVDRPGGHARRVASVERAEVELGWKATTSMADGLRSTVAWYEKVTEGGV